MAFGFIVARLYATPKTIVERAQSLLAVKKK